MIDIPMLFGPYGSNAFKHAGRFADGGANACWFHGFDERGFEACAAAGVAVCVELKTFRADFAAHPELVPIGRDGRPIRFGRLVQGVCLSKKWFLDKIEAGLTAGMRAFAPAGVWLDYLAGAGWFETAEPDLQDHCFCDDCVRAFCEVTGIDADGPDEILSRRLDAWIDHRCRQVAALAGRYAGIIRRHRPNCLVGAYMCPWAPEEFGGALRRTFAQDYPLLAEHIDVFTPLLYAAKCGRPAGWARQWLQSSRRFVPASRKVQPILDAKDFPDSLLAAAEASDPPWGLQMFSGVEVFADTARTAIFRSAVDAIRRAVEATQA